MKRYFLGVIVLVGIVGVILWLKQKPAVQLVGKSIPSIDSPFKGMTIPYLRERSYQSQLGKLNFYQDNGNYTSFLTSYTSDGLKIDGLITKPSSEMPQGGYPAIVFIHGYIPPTEYVTTERYLNYVEYLARSGYVVFKIDLRGHGESEGKAGGGYFGSDYVVDTLNAYAALQSANWINKNKIGMWGHSMAGNIILRSLAVKKAIPVAVIWAGAVYSYTDQIKYGIQDTSYRPPDISNRQTNFRRQLYAKVGSPSASSTFWQEVAPTNYLSDMKTAIEIHHAIDDTVVNIGYSRDLVSLLDKTTIPHQYFEYDSGGHNISDPSFSLAMQRTVEFFDQHLKKVKN